MICVHDPPVTDEWVAYTGYLGTLLDAAPCYVSWAELMEEEETVLAAQPLIVYQERECAWWQRHRRAGHTRQALARMGASVLVVRAPRWPIRHILLVVRAEASDVTAVSWAEHLGVQAQAAVTLLPIIPAIPAMYRHGSRVQLPLPLLLDPHTACGHYLHLFCQRFLKQGIPSRISQRQGDPNHQIQEEVNAGVYDLVLIAAEPYSRIERWLLGELVSPLLRWIDRPLLVAHQTQPEPALV